MRKIFFFLVSLDLVTIRATNTHADTYSLDFVGLSPFTAAFNATGGQVTSGSGKSAHPVR
jgi:hypothetical protein